MLVFYLITPNQCSYIVQEEQPLTLHSIKFNSIAMKIATSHRRAAAEAAHSQLSSREKGLRKTKFVPPPVTSVNWKAIEQSFLTGLASSKVGEDNLSSLSTDAINKIAFGCYSAKDLCFVLQGIGFSDAPFPTKKNQLIKTILSIRNDDTHLSRLPSGISTPPSSAAVASAVPSSSSLVSVSPQRRSIRGDSETAIKEEEKEIIDIDANASDRLVEFIFSSFEYLLFSRTYLNFFVSDANLFTTFVKLASLEPASF